MPATAISAEAWAKAFRQQLAMETSDPDPGPGPAVPPTTAQKTKTKASRREDQEKQEKEEPKQQTSVAAGVTPTIVPLPKPPISTAIALFVQPDPISILPAPPAAPSGSQDHAKSATASRSSKVAAAPAVPAAHPAADPFVEPAAYPAADPSAELVAGAAAEPAAHPAADHAAAPAADPTPADPHASELLNHPDLPMVQNAPQTGAAMPAEIAFEGRISTPQHEPSKAPAAPTEAPVQVRPTTIAANTTQSSGSETGAQSFAAAAYQTEAPARPQGPAPAAFTPAAAEPPRVEAETEPQAAAPVRDVRVQLESPVGEKAEVRVVETSGALQLTVRADATLSQALRDNLPELKTQLERSDVQADLWRPGTERVSETSAASAGHGDTASSDTRSNDSGSSDAGSGDAGSSDAGNEHGAAGQQYQSEWLDYLALTRARQQQTRRGQ